MDQEDRWLLPDGVDELLPSRAAQAEDLRRQLLDLYGSWGYALIMPPLIEYLEALLNGAGQDLDVQTFKVTDQCSGRTLGVRSDITPQAARIDAHQLRRDGVTRLCYIGSVLQARPETPMAGRNAVQIGAELFGHEGVESDLEILSLMLETLRVAGVAPIYIDVGHVAIFRALIAQARLSAADEEAVFAALQRKAGDEMGAVLRAAEVDSVIAECLTALPRLHGGVEVLERAAQELAGAGHAVSAAVEELRGFVNRFAAREPAMELHIDLGELRGYRYHTGLVFAAYTPGHSQEIARGGRYDGIGRAFGRRRAATGYSADLKTLLTLGEARPSTLAGGGILAPWSDDPALIDRVGALRRQGERVVWQLPGDPGRQECDRRLVERNNGSWEVEAE